LGTALVVLGAVSHLTATGLNSYTVAVSVVATLVDLDRSVLAVSRGFLLSTTLGPIPAISLAPVATIAALRALAVSSATATFFSEQVVAQGSRTAEKGCCD